MYPIVTIESLLPEGGREIDEKEATCYLFAVGELCRLSPAHTSSHLTLMVHSLLLATREGDGGVWCVCGGGWGGYGRDSPLLTTGHQGGWMVVMCVCVCYGRDSALLCTGHQGASKVCVSLPATMN